MIQNAEINPHIRWFLKKEAKPLNVERNFFPQQMLLEQVNLLKKKKKKETQPYITPHTNN